VKLKNNSIVNGEVSYNELLNNGQILGKNITPLQLPVEAQIPIFPMFENGSLDIKVNRSTIVTLDSGNYRDIRLKAGTTFNPTILRLNGGVYNLANLDIGLKSRVECLSNCEIRIKQKLKLGSNAFIGPASNTTLKAKDVLIFVEGINGNSGNLGATPKAVEIGKNNVIRATIYVPNGTLLIKKSSEVNGTFIGKDVQIGISAVVTNE
ncbi:MAG: hypothetical protein FD167_5801, partial [bacterium]